MTNAFLCHLTGKNLHTALRPSGSWSHCEFIKHPKKGKECKWIYKRLYIRTAERDDEDRIDQFPDGLIAQLVKHCTGYFRGHKVQILFRTEFYRLSFHNCASCVYNCDDQSHPQCKYVIFHIFISFCISVFPFQLLLVELGFLVIFFFSEEDYQRGWIIQ